MWYALTDQQSWNHEHFTFLTPFFSTQKEWKSFHNFSRPFPEEKVPSH